MSAAFGGDDKPPATENFTQKKIPHEHSANENYSGAVSFLFIRTVEKKSFPLAP